MISVIVVAGEIEYSRAMKCRRSLLTKLIDFVLKDTKIMTQLDDANAKLDTVNAKLDNVGTDIDTLMAEVLALQQAASGTVDPSLMAKIDSVVEHVTALDEKFPAPVA